MLFISTLGCRCIAVEPADRMPILRHFCWGCHSEGTETPLNLETLNADLKDPAAFQVWVKIYDKLEAGEMPPKEAEQPPRSLVSKTLNRLGDDLLKVNRMKYQQMGRVPAR